MWILVEPDGAWWSLRLCRYHDSSWRIICFTFQAGESAPPHQFTACRYHITVQEKQQNIQVHVLFVRTITVSFQMPQKWVLKKFCREKNQKKKKKSEKFRFLSRKNNFIEKNNNHWKKNIKEKKLLLRFFLLEKNIEKKTFLLKKKYFFIEFFSFWKKKKCYWKQHFLLNFSIESNFIEKKYNYWKKCFYWKKKHLWKERKKIQINLWTVPLSHILIRWYWSDEAVHSRELIWEFKQKNRTFIVHEAENIIIRTFQQ